jgi:Trk K+ transport system NAD-binding subunit
VSQQTTTPAPPRRSRQTKAVNRRHRTGPAPVAAPGVRASRGSGLRARARYRFDNALSRGAWVVIGYLGLVTLAIVFLAAIVAAIGHLAGFNGSGPLGVLEAFWQMLLRVVDGGTFASDTKWPARVLALVVTLAGIFIAGSLIGLISSAVDQRVEALRRGRSNVLERGHSVVLGWSPRVPTIVGELVLANESVRRAAIVVLADRDKTEMEEILRASVGDLRTTRLVGRRGDPSRASDLELVGAADARSILVMSGEEGDAGAIKASLAVLGLHLDDVPVVVEMQSGSQADTLEAVTDGRIITVTSDRVIAEVTAQACHSRGLAQVFRDLLDFDGDEMYLQEFPELHGATYAQVQQAFDRAAVMGLASEDGVEINPPPDRVVRPGDRVVALVEDDSKFICSGLRPIPAVAAGDEPDPEPPQRILMVGWSPLAPHVIRELDEFLAPGSRMTVVVDPALIDPAEARIERDLLNTTIDVRAMTGGAELLGDLLGDEPYDQGILLGYRRGLSPGDADARTLLTLMALRRRWPKGHPPEVRLVAEVLDQRNVHIAELAGVDDFIVSDQLASLMLAQLSERVELREVFDELFDAEGASITLRPAGRFAPDGSATFAEVVAAGNHFRESALGYRRAVDGVVLLNPPKSERLQLAAGDEVVVITSR